MLRFEARVVLKGSPRVTELAVESVVKRTLLERNVEWLLKCLDASRSALKMS